MNKNGFTLAELLAVLVLLGIVMMLILPSIRGLYSDNQTTQYEKYEELMIEYTKTLPNYENKDIVCLNDLNIKKMNEFECQGYVIKSNLKAYLKCFDKNGTKTYETNGYINQSDC